MDGVLLVDKPSGPTSHDVVMRIRRATGERGVGHTGTLDPRATGLLPLVLGRATRLASFLAGRDKTYDVAIRLGLATTTDDADGEPIGEPTTTLPRPDEVEAALDAFRGTFEQLPPNHSAKKVGGKKAYELARREQPVELKPVEVTVRSLDEVSVADGLVRLVVTATSGFYVRALARDLGRALGCGGHLEDLRRTGSGAFDVADAIALDEAERLGAGLAARLIAPAEALPDLTAITLNEGGLKRALHGNTLAPEHLSGRWVPAASAAGPVRVLAPDGQLVALAWSRGGALHPVVVLGYH
jgi:tRNA pseudouridine55 synthase